MHSKAHCNLAHLLLPATETVGGVRVHMIHFLQYIIKISAHKTDGPSGRSVSEVDPLSLATQLDQAVLSGLDICQLLHDRLLWPRVGMWYWLQNKWILERRLFTTSSFSNYQTTGKLLFWPATRRIPWSAWLVRNVTFTSDDK